MGSFSIWHWLILGVVALLLFGGKSKISDIMGDAAKGIKAFKKGMADETEEAKAVESKPADAVKPAEPAKTETPAKV